MVFKKTMAVFCDNLTKPINVPAEQNAEFFKTGMWFVCGSFKDAFSAA
jgi:hypothetical protein